jgi:hypothetical protein
MPPAIYSRLNGGVSSALLRCTQSNLRDSAAFAATVFYRQQIAAEGPAYWFGT